MRKIILASDALASRILKTEAINSSLGMEKNIPRGAELEDLALIKLLNLPIEEVLCSEVTMIDRDAIYIISNFVTLPEHIKKDLIKAKNYIIFEHDHKYTPTRNPFSFSTEGIVPNDKKINIEFYQGARKVICITEWHENQVKINTGANTANIHGGIWLLEELDLFESLVGTNLHESRYAIFWNAHKNPNEAMVYASNNKIPYRIIRTISNRTLFLEVLSKHKGLIFFPSIPETGSRLIMESKMLGLDVITNKNSGAANEYWFDKNGKELISLFRNRIFPDIVTMFKELICVD
jgi:hypothetical protein